MQPYGNSLLQDCYSEWITNLHPPSHAPFAYSAAIGQGFKPNITKPSGLPLRHVHTLVVTHNVPGIEKNLFLQWLVTLDHSTPRECGRIAAKKLEK